LISETFEKKSIQKCQQIGILISYGDNQTSSRRVIAKMTIKTLNTFKKQVLTNFHDIKIRREPKIILFSQAKT